jgi:hypothetical protein
VTRYGLLNAELLRINIYSMVEQCLHCFAFGGFIDGYGDNSTVQMLFICLDTQVASHSRNDSIISFHEQ